MKSTTNYSSLKKVKFHEVERKKNPGHRTQRFVGKNLVKELEHRDAEVVTLQDQNKKQIDIRNWQKIKDIDNLDMIYHLAAVTYVPFSFENPRKTYDVNVSGTLNMLELGRINDVDKFIL